MAAVTRIGTGVYRVEQDEKQVLVFVAGTDGDLWTFCNGEVYHDKRSATLPGSPDRRPAKAGRDDQRYELTAPMPATVVKVLVAPGQQVRHGDTLVVLEAMKMELPIRAPADAVVQAINCREGELVQPDRTLVELA
jgi:biotin carboxyl carrier protein